MFRLSLLKLLCSTLLCRFLSTHHNGCCYLEKKYGLILVSPFGRDITKYLKGLPGMSNKQWNPRRSLRVTCQWYTAEIGPNNNIYQRSKSTKWRYLTSRHPHQCLLLSFWLRDWASSRPENPHTKIYITCGSCGARGLVIVWLKFAKNKFKNSQKTRFSTINGRSRYLYAGDEKSLSSLLLEPISCPCPCHSSTYLHFWFQSSCLQIWREIKAYHQLISLLHFMQYVHLNINEHLEHWT